MKDVIYRLFHLLTSIARLFQPGGSKAVIAETLQLKQQLIMHSRSRQRAPNLHTHDRVLGGFMSLFLSPRRIVRAAIIMPSTLFHFHKALGKRKRRLLYSPCGGRKPGTKGPSREIIEAMVKMKHRNPRYGCPRIAQQINLAFGLDLDKDAARRILAVHHRPDPADHGPSWLTTLGNAKDCRGLFQLPVAARSASSPGTGFFRVAARATDQRTNDSDRVLVCNIAGSRK
jgi:hypothetical protein